MKFAKNSTFAASVISATMLAAFVPAGVQAAGSNNSAITIYFTRHAEKQTITTEVGPASSYTTLDTNDFVDLYVDNEKGNRLDQVCAEAESEEDTKCAEELSKEGLLRAELLATWFKKRGVIKQLDAAISSHKIRTMQTILPTAKAAGLTVKQVPVGGTELNPVSTTPSECATLEEIANASPGDTLLIAGHSGTLYDIMGAGNGKCPEFPSLGLDTSNEDRFPVDEDGKVRDFGDIWKVLVYPNGETHFSYRVNLQPKKLSVDNYSY